MLVPMAKIAIVGHRRRLDAMVELLQRLALVQPIDVTARPPPGAAPYAPDDAQTRETERLRALRARIEALLRLVPERLKSSEPPIDILEVYALERELDALTPEVDARVRERDALEHELEVLPRHHDSLRRLLPLMSELVELESYETMALLIDRRHADALELLRIELAAMLGEQFELLYQVVDANMTGALLVFPRVHSAEVHALLGRSQVSRVRLPEEYEGMSFADAMIAMEHRIDELPQRIADSTAQLHALLEGRSELASLATEVDKRLARLALLHKLGATERTVMLVGWVPQRELRRLERALADEIGDEALVFELVADADERPPVLLRNRPLARPFEALIRMFALPHPNSFDATPLVAVFLPLFFGMMLGDVAHGVILLGLSLVLRRRFANKPVLADLARMLTLGSLWGIAWGVLFGEFFGGLGARWLGMRPLWLGRDDAHAVMPLFGFSVALGAIHITLGLLLGIYGAWRVGNKHKLVERVGQLGALIGLFVAAGAALQMLPRGWLTPAIALVVVGLVTLASQQGALGLLLGPLELLSTVGNVLSYLRIAAIGLASVYLSQVANDLGAAAPLWLGVIVATLLHALNLALGAFSPSIQALRLQYVEFFGKFYEEGGEAFRPFGAEEP